MSRKLLIISLVLLVAGLGILLYADPLARLSFGVRAPRSTLFNSTITRSFTFTGGGTFTIPSGALTGRGAGGGSTIAVIATLGAVALFGVGLVLEVLTIFLWQGDRKEPPRGEAASQPDVTS